MSADIQENCNGFALIPGGAFLMGSPPGESWDDPGNPQHQVTVSSFYLSKYQVTQQEYTAVTGTNPSFFKGATLPVEQVSWLDAIEYCNLRSLKERLTTVYTRNGDTA